MAELSKKKFPDTQSRLPDEKRFLSGGNCVYFLNRGVHVQDRLTGYTNYFRENHIILLIKHVPRHGLSVARKNYPVAPPDHIA